MGDMKCNEDTINPSYIEKNNKRRPKHDPTNGKKRTEGLFCIVFYYFIEFCCNVGNSKERIFEWKKRNIC